MSGVNVGTIRQVMGPVIDVEFANGKLPELNNALKIIVRAIIIAKTVNPAITPKFTYISLLN